MGRHQLHFENFITIIVNYLKITISVHTSPLWLDRKLAPELETRSSL